ncbi:MAG: lysine--tRNA ligase, partial [Bacteroidota bacterium]
SQVCPGSNLNPMIAHTIQATYLSIISCFPQMKPETKAVQLTEDEKVLMNILKANSPVDLNELKDQTGLSNKKWDKAIKGLTKNKLARVEKTDAGLLVSLV